MSEETFQFAPTLHTERLTLTLVDLNNKADEEEFSELLAAGAREILKLEGEEVTRNVQECIDFYRSYGRIQPKFLGGRKADRCAIWLVRLGANSPEGKCIGAAYMVQRSVIPDQAWVIVPEYRGQGYAAESAKEVLRYFRDDLGIQQLMALIHPSSPKSPNVAKRAGYVLFEDRVMFQDGVTALLMYATSTTTPFPKDVLFKRFDRME
ncbi:hypothetical protein TARUN_4464 [Trichoderma arundinaceum]|uniref:N-acetyltransferase domain-containing protein n=1 Tax=Trichoderma arundinaceum TaxID=490622 RepID=A0A395NPB9_TRIAR|nr:hypothetical protein TARUN_4464 [Trichoderma arundinaceum]